jgi:hypothetical protein
MLAENLPDTSFEYRGDTKETTKLSPEINHKASLKKFAIKVGLVVVIAIAVFAAIAYIKSSSPPKPNSLSTFG